MRTSDRMSSLRTQLARFSVHECEAGVDSLFHGSEMPDDSMDFPEKYLRDKVTVEFLRLLR
jgi:hypothetical protein